MNFFEHQDRARRKTGMLVWLFAVAVAGQVLDGASAVRRAGLLAVGEDAVVARERPGRARRTGVDVDPQAVGLGLGEARGR